jgi:hypothetical protein
MKKNKTMMMQIMMCMPEPGRRSFLLVKYTFLKEIK